MSTAHLIPDSTIDLMTAAFDSDRVDRDQADAIREALADWDARHPGETGAATALETLHRTGVINRWNGDEPFGFVTEDRTGTPWYVHRKALPPGLGLIPKGTRVVFHGDPCPAPGRRYPKVRGIVLASKSAGGNRNGQAPDSGGDRG